MDNLLTLYLYLTIAVGLVGLIQSAFISNKDLWNIYLESIGKGEQELTIKEYIKYYPALFVGFYLFLIIFTPAYVSYKLDESESEYEEKLRK